MTDSYNEAVGRRLRSIRKQKGLSLQDVEANSEQEFKASVLGAYERGERSLSLPRMQRLAAFYGVPVDQLLPSDGRSQPWASRPGTVEVSRSISGRSRVPQERVPRYSSAFCERSRSCARISTVGC